MTSDDRRERVAAITRMFELSASEATPEKIQGYVEETAGVPQVIFRQAISRALKKHAKDPFAPGIGEIVAAGNELWAAYRRHHEQLEQAKEEARYAREHVSRKELKQHAKEESPRGFVARLALGRGGRLSAPTPIPRVPARAGDEPDAA